MLYSFVSTWYSGALAYCIKHVFFMGYVYVEFLVFKKCACVKSLLLKLRLFDGHHYCAASYLIV
jgi:hypothetical protein